MNDISKKKFNELTSEEKNHIKIFVFKQIDTLNNLYIGTVERSITALFLVNGGGVVSILAYLPNKKISFCQKILLSMSLVSFLLGLILAIIVVFLDFQGMFSIISEYPSKIDKYFSDKITYQQLNEGSGYARHIVYIGYFSLSFIFIGILFGLIGYFN